MDNTFEMQVENNASISNAAKRWEKLRRISKASIGLQIMLIVVIVFLSINAVYVQIKYSGISKEVVREVAEEKDNKEQFVKLRRDLSDVQADVEDLHKFKDVAEREIDMLNKAIVDLIANHSEVRTDLHEVIRRGNNTDRTVNTMLGKQKEMKESLTSDLTNQIGSIKQYFKGKFDDLDNRLNEGENKMASKGELLQLNSQLTRHLSDYDKFNRRLPSVDRMSKNNKQQIQTLKQSLSDMQQNIQTNKDTVSQLNNMQNSFRKDVNTLRESTRNLTSAMGAEIKRVGQETRQNSTKAMAVVQNVKADLELMRASATEMNKLIKENQNRSKSLSERVAEAEMYLKALLNSSKANETCGAVLLALPQNQTIELQKGSMPEKCVYQIFSTEPKRIIYKLSAKSKSGLASVIVDGNAFDRRDNGKQKTSKTSILVISLPKSESIESLKLSYYAK